MSELDQAAVGNDAPTATTRPSPVVLALGVLGAILAAVAVWFLVVAPLLSGEEAALDTASADLDPGAGGSATPEAPDDPAAEGGDADALEDLPLVTFEVFLARDPFEPVIPEPEPTDTTTPTTNSDTPPESTDGSTPTTAPPPDDGTATPPPDGSHDTDTDTVQPPPDGGDTRSDDGGRILSLIEIDTVDGERVAVVQVDSTIFEVRAGDRFAGDLLVDSISDTQVVLIRGDEIIRLEEGSRVLK